MVATAEVKRYPETIIFDYIQPGVKDFELELIPGESIGGVPLQIIEPHPALILNGYENDKARQETLQWVGRLIQRYQQGEHDEAYNGFCERSDLLRYLADPQSVTTYRAMVAVNTGMSPDDILKQQEYIGIGGGRLWTPDFSQHNSPDAPFLYLPLAEALRTRAAVVRQLMLDAIREASQEGKGVSLTSLACGASQSPLEAIYLASQENIFIPMNALLVDTDQQALAFAEEMARRLEFDIQTINEDVLKDDWKKAVSKCNNERRIVEVVGLTDYLSQNLIGRVLKRIYDDVLNKGDGIVTAHIGPGEDGYLKNLFNLIRWKYPGSKKDKGYMNFRSGQEFIEIIQEALPAATLNAIQDPHGIFTIVQITKT